MTKDVLIAISGFQFQQFENADFVESITKGDYYKNEKNHVVLFEELVSDSDQTTQNEIRFSDSHVSVNKKGFLHVNMLFEENKKHISNYATPYGNFLLGLDTKKVEMTEEDNRILVQVDYALELNYEYLADCQLVMDIRSQDADFSLNHNPCPE